MSQAFSINQSQAASLSLCNLLTHLACVWWASGPYACRAAPKPVGHGGPRLSCKEND